MRRKYNLSELCFYLFWLFLQIGKGLGYTSRDREFVWILVCAIPFVLGRMLLIKWDRRSLGNCIVLNILGLAIFLFSNTTTYFLSIICITAARGIDIKKVLKISLFVRGGLFIIRTTMAICGYADMQVSYRYIDSAMPVARYALGYVHPNTTQYELFMLTILVVYLYGERFRIYHYLIAIGYAFFIYSYTDSRTSLVLEVLFVAAVVVCSYGKGRWLKQKVIWLSTKSWILGLGFTILGCIAYVYIPSFRTLGTFSSRFLTATNVIMHAKLSLFGNQDITTDLGYVYLLYSGGVFLTILFFYGMNKLLKKEIIKADIALCLAFACYSVFNILEAYTYSVLSNPLLLYLLYVIYPMKTKSVNSESAVLADMWMNEHSLET